MKGHLHKTQVFIFFLFLLNLNLFSQSFNEQTDISLPDIEQCSVVWGDYDNDGYIDILMTGLSFEGRIAKIYRNKGDNIFEEQAEISLLPVTSGSSAWGDYDNDNDLDLIISGYHYENEVTSYITKIYQNNGNNNFNEQTEIILPGVYNSSIDWGDYNNDGDLDILLSGYSTSGYISRIFRNNRDNTFTEQTEILLHNVWFGSSLWGDYDNDGYLDILLTGNDYTGIFRNNGNNTFTEQTDIDLIALSFSSADWGDYDNDGYLDILLIGQDSQGLRISKIYRNDGDNSFTAQDQIILTGLSFGTADWGDYDSDGYLDIIISGSFDSYSDSTIIYHNTGSNGFTEVTGLNLPGINVGSVAWVDYDNDNDLDIFLSGDIYSIDRYTGIYRNETTNTNSEPASPDGLNSYWGNEGLIFSWNKSSDDHIPAEAISYNIRIGTTPGGSEVKSAQSLHDGKSLLPKTNTLVNDTCNFYILPFNKYYWSVQAVDNTGLSSSFAPEENSPLDSIQAGDLQAFIKPGNSLLVRWTNGNGFRRVLFGRLSDTAEIAKPVDGTEYFAEPYFGNGDKIGTTGWYCLYNGSADSAIIYGLSEGYSYDLQVIEYIEVDGLPVYFTTTGNGNPGIFSSSLFSEMTGTGLAAMSSGAIANWGDFNNDGLLDILLSGTEGAKVYINDGNSFFAEKAYLSPGTLYNAFQLIADTDNDNDLDIILGGIVNSVDPFIKLFSNSGDGTFTDLGEISSVFSGYGGGLECGDYDNDADIDIINWGRSISTLKPYTSVFQNDNNNFIEQTDIELTGVVWSSVVLGDYDNDCDLDILLTGSEQFFPPPYVPVTKVYRNDGNDLYSEQTDINLLNVCFSSAEWGDYDNDGDLDIVLSGESSDTLNKNPISKIYRNDYNNVFTEQSGILLPGMYSNAVAWADCNNDGNLDLLLGSHLFLNNGNNTFTEQTGVGLSGASGSKADWGDFDNDGDLDLLIGSKFFRNNTFMRAGSYFPNTKPEAPVNLKSVLKPDGIELTWAPVKNDETDYKTMTYNVRIGTLKSNSDICPPHSDLNIGYRKIAAKGNAQLDTVFYVKNLIPGKYYWGVQAVDQGLLGGEWSVVDSFEVKNVQAFYDADEVCLGYPTIFTDQSVATDGIASWHWDFKDGETSSEQNPVHLFSASGTYNVKLVITDNGGVKDSLEKNIIVKPKPITGFSAPDVCQGIPVTVTNITDNNGLTISSWGWDFGDGNTSTDQQPAPNPYLAAGDYSIKLKAIASNGCADSVTNTVSVGAYPVAAVTANAPLSFCKGDSVILSVPYNTTYIYNWMAGGTGLTNGDSCKYVAKFTGDYSVTVVNPKGNCTTISSVVSVTAQDAPNAPSISVDGDTEFCQGDSVILSVINTLNDSYWWKLNGGAVGSDSCRFAAKNTGTYNLTVTNSSGCSANSTDSINVIVNTIPVVGDLSLSGSASFCNGDSVILSIPSVAGYSYNWRNDYGLISGAETNSYTATTSGTYKLEVSNSTGCMAWTSPVNITVKPSPEKPVLEATNYTDGVCPGDDPIRLSAGLAVPGLKYLWYKDGQPQYNDTLPYLELYEQGFYKLKTELGECSNESEIFTINLPDAPEKPMIYAQGSAVWYLVCSTKDAREYGWYCNGKLIEGANDYYYVAGRKMGDYQVSIGNIQGCFTRSDIITIPTGDTGMDDVDPFEGLKIYPNPTTGLFTIEIDNNIFGELMVSVFSEQGKELLATRFEKSSEHFSTQIDLNGKPEGLYIINLLIDRYLATRKIIIE